MSEFPLCWNSITSEFVLHRNFCYVGISISSEFPLYQNSITSKEFPLYQNFCCTRFSFYFRISVTSEFHFQNYFILGFPLHQNSITPLFPLQWNLFCMNYYVINFYFRISICWNSITLVFLLSLSSTTLKFHYVRILLHENFHYMRIPLCWNFHLERILLYWNFVT